MGAKLDKHDLNLLTTCQRWTFPKSVGSQNRAFELFQKGLLKRKFAEYSAAAGRSTASYRWSYKTTVAGQEALHAAAPQVDVV